MAELEVGTGLVCVHVEVDFADVADYGVPGGAWVLATTTRAPDATAAVHRAANLCVTAGLVRVPGHPPRHVGVVVTTDLLAAVPLCYMAVVPAALWAEAAAQLGSMQAPRHGLLGVGVDDVLLHPALTPGHSVLAHLATVLRTPPGAVLAIETEMDANAVAAVFAQAPLRGAAPSERPPAYAYRLARFLWCCDAARADRQRLRDALAVPSNPCHEHALARVCARAWPHHARVGRLVGGKADAAHTLRRALALPVWLCGAAVSEK